MHAYIPASLSYIQRKYTGSNFSRRWLWRNEISLLKSLIFHSSSPFLFSRSNLILNCRMNCFELSCYGSTAFFVDMPYFRVSNFQESLHGVTFLSIPCILALHVVMFLFTSTCEIAIREHRVNLSCVANRNKTCKFESSFFSSFWEASCLSI